MFDSPMAQNLLSLIYPFNFKRSSSKAFENARVRVDTPGLFFGKTIRPDIPIILCTGHSAGVLKY